MVDMKKLGGIVTYSVKLLKGGWVSWKNASQDFEGLGYSTHILKTIQNIHNEDSAIYKPI